MLCVNCTSHGFPLLNVAPHLLVVLKLPGLLGLSCDQQLNGKDNIMTNAALRHYTVFKSLC